MLLSLLCPSVRQGPVMRTYVYVRVLLFSTSNLRCIFYSQMFYPWALPPLDKYFVWWQSSLIQEILRYPTTLPLTPYALESSLKWFATFPLCPAQVEGSLEAEVPYSHDTFSYCDDEGEQRGKVVANVLQQVRFCILLLTLSLTWCPFRQNLPLLPLIDSVIFQTLGGLSTYHSQNQCLLLCRPLAPFCRFSSTKWLLIHLFQG